MVPAVAVGRETSLVATGVRGGNLRSITLRLINGVGVAIGQIMILKDETASVDMPDFKRMISQNYPVEKTRLDRLIEIVDHCTAARTIAEATGDGFLAYMLAMTIQAARTEMRPKTLRSRK